MIDRLKIMDARYEELNRLLSDPEVVCDIKKLTEYSKEQRSLEKAVNLYREYTKLQDAIPDLKEMKASDDAEIAEMAAMELEESLDLGSNRTALNVLEKVRTIMKYCDRNKLRGEVYIDDIEFYTN